MRQGEFEAAVTILVHGLNLAEQVPLLRPPLAADLGVAYARCGQIAEGLEQIEPAVAAARSMGRYSRLPLLDVKCGQVHLLAGHIDEATRLATSALRLAEEQNERGNQAYARLLLAECRAADRSDVDVAARSFDEALALATELGMLPLVAHCHAGLAHLYGRNAERDRGERHLVAAAAMYRTMGMRYWAEQLDRDMGAVEVPV